MRLREFTDPKYYILPNTEGSDPSNQNERILTGTMTDDSARNLTKTVEIKKPRPLDTH
jgi:hypothetical protein